MEIKIDGNDIEVIMTLAEWQEEFACASRGAEGIITPAVENELSRRGLPTNRFQVVGSATCLHTINGERMQLHGKVEA